MKALFIAILLGLSLLGAQAQSPNVPTTTASTPIAISTATTTLVITGVAGQRVYVTAFGSQAAVYRNLQYISATEATCVTGTTNITGTYNFNQGRGSSGGSGGGALMLLPVGHSLCIVTTQAVVIAGFLAYTVF